MNVLASAVLLARLQFAFTLIFHFVFPAMSIGLASYLLVLEGLWLWRKDALYFDLFRYWLRIFALVFAMGVVSGLVMSYQFGTNWAEFSRRTGPILGPLMTYEVLTAFFLEAGFLGVMLFGVKRVGRTAHFGATAMVALGTAISAFWILSANSWMHTPTGFAVTADGQFVPAGSWWKIVFNPSFPYRFTHTLLAAYLTTAMVVGGTGAWHLLKQDGNAAARRMLSMALWMATLVTPLQILAGDQQGLNTLRYQPVKIMALEGHYQSHPNGAPLILFGIPDDEHQRIDYAVSIPDGSSLLLRHDAHASLPGLDTVPRELRPPVAILFWSFRIMVGCGMLMLSLGIWSLIARWRGRLATSRPLLRATVLASPLGFIAVIAGWITTEVGRQPYTVYGQLLTRDSASPLGAPAVAASLLVFVCVYLLVFGAGIGYVLRLLREPLAVAVQEPISPTRTAGITPASAVIAGGSAAADDR